LYHITALHAKRVPTPQLMLGKGKVTVNNLATKSRKGDDSWKKRKYGAFYMTIPDDADVWKTRFGHLPSATCYCHVQPSTTSGRWWLVYCFFYPFNGSIAKAIEVTHEGDWEHVKVEVDKTGTKIHRIYFAAHGGGKWVSKATASRKGFECVQSTHPVVYSARDSHASYPAKGKQARGLLPADHTGTGKTLDCWKGPRFTLLGNKSAPPAGQDWLRFSGFWGHLGSGLPVVVPDRGPMGPAYKTWWRDC
ncbi:MAG: Vps62-related protein, partial [Chloroflexi bacterium]|nr:Vps62-related protein [Chloroflexota bacterium]